MYQFMIESEREGAHYRPHRHARTTPPTPHSSDYFVLGLVVVLSLVDLPSRVVQEHSLLWHDITTMALLLTSLGFNATPCELCPVYARVMYHLALY
jgi:hypothetical protein